MFGLRYLSNVVTLRLDAGQCSGCGRCVEVCPHAVFVLTNRKAEIVDRDACMECGACALNCSPGALTVSAGVGCATAVIASALAGHGERVECGCGD